LFFTPLVYTFFVVHVLHLDISPSI
jgi:hypothetical protein